MTSQAKSGDTSERAGAAEILAVATRVAGRPHVPLGTSNDRQQLQYKTIPKSCNSIAQLSQLAVDTVTTRPSPVCLRNPAKRKRNAPQNVGELTPRKASRGLGNGIRKDNRGKGPRREASAMRCLLEAGAPAIQQLCMKHIPSPGNLPPIVVQSVVGLITQLTSLRAALAKHKDKMVCLDIEWGTGYIRGRKRKNSQAGYIPSLLQFACRGHRAVIVDLLTMIPGRRELDPRQITVCDSSSSVDDHAAMNPVDQVVLGCAMALRARGKPVSVESIHDFCKGADGKALKDVHKVRTLGQTKIVASVASQDR